MLILLAGHTELTTANNITQSVFAELNNIHHSILVYGGLSRTKYVPLSVGSMNEEPESDQNKPMLIVNGANQAGSCKSVTSL